MTKTNDDEYSFFRFGTKLLDVAEDPGISLIPMACQVCSGISTFVACMHKAGKPNSFSCRFHFFTVDKLKIIFE